MSSDQTELHPTETQPTDPAALVADAVLAVPGVHDLHAGLLGEVATYLPGRRIQGVRLREESCDVHLVLDWDAPVARTTEAVRAALAPLVDVPVNLTVEDIAPPPHLDA